MGQQSSQSTVLLEAFRSLRSQLLLRLREGQKTILVTSARAAEGKSVVAANLSVVFAAAGKSVLLVDGDLRSPSLHKLLGVENRPGLCQVFDSGAMPSQGLTRIGERLSFLPAGTGSQDAERVLSQPAVATMFRALKQSYDFIIVDAPAALACADAELLARHCDGALLVLGAGQVSAPEIRLARERLEGSGVPVLGSVLNGVADSEDQLYSGLSGATDQQQAVETSKSQAVLPIGRAASSVE